MRNPITTHVLDISRGQPAAGMHVSLEFHEEGKDWKTITSGVTNTDGRITDWLPEDTQLAAGNYRLTFDTGSYFHKDQQECFYPSVTVNFDIKDSSVHFHVPLLVSPFGYTTYRGS